MHRILVVFNRRAGKYLVRTCVSAYPGSFNSSSARFTIPCNRHFLSYECVEEILKWYLHESVEKLVSLGAIFIDCIKTFLWQNFTSVFSRERVFTYIYFFKKGGNPAGIFLQDLTSLCSCSLWLQFLCLEPYRLLWRLTIIRQFLR